VTVIRFLSLLVALVVGTSVAAQTNITLGAINADPSEPVEITADSLSVDQDTGVAVFSGNVRIGQGDLRLSAGDVRVIYDGQSGEVSRLSITGGVTFVTSTEAAEAETADYDLLSGTLLLSGNVLVTQGQSAISADRIRIDLNSGSAVMEGQVRTILNQGDN